MKKESRKIILSLAIIALFVGCASLVVAADPVEVIKGISNFFVDFIKIILQYTIGEVPLELIEEYGVNNAWIVVAAIWALIFITFADVIETFSSFGRFTSVAVAFLVAVIAANTRLIGKGVIEMTQWFVWGGTAAVYAALGVAFIAFIAVNSGVWFLSKWVLKRKAMMHAAKAAAGGEKAISAIQHYKKVGKELEQP